MASQRSNPNDPADDLTATPLDDPPQHIFRWDLDKTYLDTDFDTFGDLIRTFLQKPEDKVNVPGADALLRELLRREGRHQRLVTFISGSPRQMRRVLEEKLRLDGIEPDYFILKPNLRNLLRGRFRALRGQIGYKLKALLTIRLKTPVAPETLFGDDAEQDALIYCLYDDIVAGRVGRAHVAEILEAARVYPDVIAQILQLIRDNRLIPSVSRIFINLNRHTPTATFNPYGPRLVPIHNYFQAALILFADQTLPATPILRIALDMNQRHRYTPAMLANSFQDLIRRRRLDPAAAESLAQALREAPRPDAAVPSGLRPGALIEEFTSRLEAISDRRAAPLLSDMGVPDYHALVKAHV